MISSGKIAEMIVVLPDSQTRLGGSWYSNSPTTGNWQDFIAVDLVHFVDQKFRTLADRSARGLAGQSMGAYGALRIGMSNPDVFGAILALSPVHSENPNPLGEQAIKAALVADTDRIDSAPIPARVVWSKAAAFSPDPSRPSLFARLPFEQKGEETLLIKNVWERWLESTLKRWIPLHRVALRRLVLRFEVGNEDPLADEVRRLSRDLESHQVDHEVIVFPGGHVKGVRHQLESSVFQFFSRFFLKSQKLAR